METLALVIAVGVLGFIGFKFYQKKRKTEDVVIEKVEPESFKFPDPPQASPTTPTTPAEFPMAKEVTSEPFRGFPKSPEPVVETPAPKAKPARKPREAKPKAVPTTPKKPRKTKAA